MVINRLAIYSSWQEVTSLLDNGAGVEDVLNIMVGESYIIEPFFEQYVESLFPDRPRSKTRGENFLIIFDSQQSRYRNEQNLKQISTARRVLIGQLKIAKTTVIAAEWKVTDSLTTALDSRLELHLGDPDFQDKLIGLVEQLIPINRNERPGLPH